MNTNVRRIVEDFVPRYVTIHMENRIVLNLLVYSSYTSSDIEWNRISESKPMCRRNGRLDSLILIRFSA